MTGPGGGPRPLSFARCRRLARTVGDAERGRAAVAAFRPRSPGVWPNRAPLSVAIWVASRERRLVGPLSEQEFAIVDPPSRRQRDVRSERTWLAAVSAIERAWQPAMFAACATVGMLVVALASLLAPIAGLLAVAGLLALVTVVLLSGLIGSVMAGYRSTENTNAAGAQTGSWLAEHWTAALMHAPDERAMRELIDATRAEIWKLWTGLPQHAGDVEPHRFGVVLDAVTTSAGRRALREWPDSRGFIIGSPSIVVIGPARAPGADPRLDHRSPSGLFTVVGTMLVALPLLAALVQWQEQAACAGSCGAERPTSYLPALIWTLGQTVFMADPAGLRAASTFAALLSIGLRVYAVVLLGVVATGVQLIRGFRAEGRRRLEWVLEQGRSNTPKIAILTALPEEFTAVRELLTWQGGRVHDPSVFGIFGELPGLDGQVHSVVLAQTVEAGNIDAAVTLEGLRRLFPSIDIVVMCGIACGVPRIDDPARHVRLGDIVVGSWGVVGYDHLDVYDDTESPRGDSPAPAHRLRVADNELKAAMAKGLRPWEAWLQREWPAQFHRPLTEPDLVPLPTGSVAHPDALASGHLHRPKVLWGRIGSADKSLRSAKARDEVARRFDLAALEMESYGVAVGAQRASLGYFVVRGISDYGDKLTVADWRGYAAVTAACYVRALLACCSVEPSPPRPE